MSDEKEVKEVKRLLDLYEQYRNSTTEDDSMQQFGANLNRSVIQNYIRKSIINDLSPDKVLSAIFESIGENQTNLISDTIKVAVNNIKRWQFSSTDKARAFTLVLCKTIPQVSGLKTSFQILDKVFLYACKLKDGQNKQYVVESLLSLIPPLFHHLHEEQSLIKINEEEATCQAQCQKWINEVLKSQFPDFMISAVIETFTELPLSEEQITLFIDNILMSASFNQLSVIADKLFPALRKYPKHTYKCLLELIQHALKVEKIDFHGQNAENIRAQCALIKTLFTVSNTSRTVLDCLVKILTSSTELPTHFTPFLVSLSFDASRLNTKIKDSTQKFFSEQIKDESLRVRSRFLSHIYSKEVEILFKYRLEDIMRYAIKLSKINLETNAHHFIEFAFNLIDNSKSGPGFKRTPLTFQESSSDFIPEPVRQIEIGVQILKDCLENFLSSSSEIFGQIVQRLISNSPNSVYLVQCLDSPENLLDVIDYMQYLELPVVEQLMRFAVPKISGNEAYLDRAILAARKSFFNRTEKAKLNGVAALFYLILPRQEQTYTQCITKEEITAEDEALFGKRVGAATNEDTQHDIFALMRRGFTQGDNVQADIYFFVPFLLKQCPELNTVVCSAFRERLDSISSTNDEEENGGEGGIGRSEFPLKVTAAAPHFLHCLSQCQKILPESILAQEDWVTLSRRLSEISEAVSNVDFDYLLDTMEMFAHPDQRESVIALISVLFNHTFMIDKDVALSLFRLYDRITHKKAEINRMRKDELKSKLQFPHFMDIDMLRSLFKQLEIENGDYYDNYGIQLYALESAKTMIAELSELRLELRSERLKRVINLGEILYGSYINVKWTDAPAGFKTNVSLVDNLTTSFRQLFTFVFETYAQKKIQSFLTKTDIISPKQRIDDAHSEILLQINKNIRSGKIKSAENFCAIAEQIALITPYDNKMFKKVQKMLNPLINTNSPFAGRILRLARFYSPKNDLDWLFAFADLVVDRTEEGGEQEVTYSSALVEMISTIGVYLGDIEWAIKVWVPQVNAVNVDESAKYAAQFSVYLIQVLEITEKLLKIDFKKFPPNYYESLIKFINELYRELNKLLKTTISIPSSTNEALEGLVKKITSDFDEKVINFTIANQVNDNKPHKGVSRQDRFDATHAPLLHFLIDKFRTTVKTMVEKKLLDDDILESFCRLKGTDVKLPKMSKKKKQKILEDEENEIDNVQQQQQEDEPEPENEPEPEPEPENEEEENEDL